MKKCNISFYIARRKVRGFIIKFLFSILLFYLWLYQNCYGDEWGSFYKKLYVSENYKYEAYIEELNYSGRGKIEIFERSEDQCKLIWQTEILQLPRSAYISNDGKYFVVIDQWGGNTGLTSGFILYSEGKLIKSYTISELIGDIEKLWKEKKIERSESSIWWYESYKTNFDKDHNYFIITTTWGKKIVFDLSNGKIVERDDFQPILKLQKKNYEIMNFKKLVSLCNADKNVKRLKEILKNDPELPEITVHTIFHHPEKEIRFNIKAEVDLNGAIYEIYLPPFHTKEKFISINFDAFTFEKNCKILSEEIRIIKKENPELQITSVLNNGITFNIKVADYLFWGGSNFDFEDNNVKWSYKMDDFKKFVNLLISNKFYNVYDKANFKKIYITKDSDDLNPKYLALTFEGKTVKYDIDSGKISIEYLK